MTFKMFTEVFMERHHQRVSTHTVNVNFSKQFGLCSLMRSLWKPTIMESWYNVWMESSVGSICAFSHTLLTILKSKYWMLFRWDKLNFIRVLLLGIRFLSTHPCPCCVVKKKDFIKMGMRQDMKCWAWKAWIDSIHQQCCIQQAQKLIFKIRASISGSCMQDLLNDESYVPTMVFPLSFNYFADLTMYLI